MMAAADVAASRRGPRGPPWRSSARSRRPRRPGRSPRARAGATRTAASVGRRVAQAQVLAGDPVRDGLGGERRRRRPSVASNSAVASGSATSTAASYGTEPERRPVPRPPGRRQLRQVGAQRVEPGPVDVERRQVRLREVAVVVGRLLGPHVVRRAAVVGPAARLLGERLARRRAPRPGGRSRTRWPARPSGTSSCS